MSATIPDSHRDLLDGPLVVTVSTVMPDGQPQALPLWCSYDENHLLINTDLRSQRARNIAANPKVTILALDPNNPFRYIEIRGRVVEQVTGAAANDFQDRQALVYVGKKFFGGHWPADAKATAQRVTYKIEPTKVKAS